MGTLHGQGDGILADVAANKVQRGLPIDAQSAPTVGAAPVVNIYGVNGGAGGAKIDRDVFTDGNGHWRTLLVLIGTHIYGLAARDGLIFAGSAAKIFAGAVVRIKTGVNSGGAGLQTEITARSVEEKRVGVQVARSGVAALNDGVGDGRKRSLIVQDSGNAVFPNNTVFKNSASRIHKTTIINGPSSLVVGTIIIYSTINKRSNAILSRYCTA